MKKSKLFLLGTLVVLLAFGMILTGCGNDDSDLTAADFVGNWRGVAGVGEVHVTITATTWSYTMPDLPHMVGSGTYTVSGLTATMFSAGGVNYGTATLVNRNTMNITLSQEMGYPGTSVFTRR